MDMGNKDEGSQHSLAGNLESEAKLEGIRE